MLLRAVFFPVKEDSTLFSSKFFPRSLGAGSSKIHNMFDTPLPQVSKDVGGSGTVSRVSSLDDALQRRAEDARSRGKVLR